MAHKILLLVQGKEDNYSFSKEFEKHNFQLVTVNCEEDFLELLKKSEVDLVLVDSHSINKNFPDQSITQIIASETQNLPFIFLGNDSTNINRVDTGFKLVLNLPVNFELLIKTVQNVLTEKLRREEWNSREDVKKSSSSFSPKKDYQLKIKSRLQSGE
tara:strand:+ start:567 stop:1040 length:474 start_codon:yes stop_codon:yes gene_type:complete